MTNTVVLLNFHKIFLCFFQLVTDAPLIQALKLFLERRISAIPIVDSEGRAIDLFAKIDIVVSTFTSFFLYIGC